ncbi:unnamed protein product [Gadus morhua 'NCC']
MEKARTRWGAAIWWCSYLVVQLPGGAATWWCSYLAVQLPGGAATWWCSYLAVQLPGGAATWRCSYLVVQLPGGAATWRCSYLVVELPGGAATWWWSSEVYSEASDFMRSLITSMDFRSLEVKLFKAKQLFLFLLEGQAAGGSAAATPPGRVGAEQLLVELRAGGVPRRQEAAVEAELRRLRSLDLLDFLAHLPLFILIHRSIVANPLDESSKL